MIRKICLAAVASVIGAALFAAPSGAAGITPLKTTIDGSFDSVQSGTDLYWVDFEDRSGDSIVRRKSLVDGSVQRLARFEDEFFALSMYAGGNYLYVSLISDEGEDPDATGTSTKVVRIARDGSSITTLAEGKVATLREVIVKNGKAILNDCGTDVEADTVSATGAIVIRETTFDRESARCGGKPNVNHVRYYELSVSGAVREIYSYDSRIKKRIKVHRNGSWSGSREESNVGVGMVSLVGDRAAFSLGSKGRVFVRDLATGGLTGPYSTGISGEFVFQYASLDSAGRLAMNGLKVKDIDERNPSVEIRAGVVRAPGDPASYLQLFKSKTLAFCGDRLIAFSNKNILELDVQTLTPIRTITEFNTKQSRDATAGCLGDYVHVVRFANKSETYLSYPLG